MTAEPVEAFIADTVETADTLETGDTLGTAENLQGCAQRYSPAQLRTCAIAIELFAEHGVGGTSLSMIADALGVTKAAVYHQFSTKEAIVTAVMVTELARLEVAIDASLTSKPIDTTEAREALLAAVIDNVVANRRALRTLQGDPVLAEALAQHRPARRFFAWLFAALLGHDESPAVAVRAAVLSSAIGAVGHPFVDRLDDDTLRSEMFTTLRGLTSGTEPH